ncbi:MAG: helix-turn-helix transcriptional regulator [bacterium]|nr:helix-turn-helix transcriptional regulator [bacterium]
MRRSEFIELGLRLTMIRKKLKLSQRRLAAACGMSNNYLCEVEKGQHQPGYDFLKEVVNRYRINFRYLTTGEGPMFQGPAVPAPVKTERKAAGKADGAGKTEIDKMLWHMERVPAVKHAVLECFNRYLYDNKAMIEDALGGGGHQGESKPDKVSRG